MASSLPQKQIITSGSFASSFNSSSANLSLTLGYSVQINWTGGSTPVGTFQLQASNNDSDWSDISGSSAAVSSNSGTALFNVKDVQYNYVRVTYTKTSGSGGTINAYVDSKN